jgi:hypothetical protein
MRVLLTLTVLMFVAACASDNRGGWTGSGAAPFGQAESQCQAQTNATGGAAFDACMAAKGWTHPR